MPFPEVDRVFYQKSPLVEVVARAGFPATLTIESEKPVELQKCLKAFFPFYELHTEQRLGDELSGGAAETLIDVSHEFKTEDENWSLVLEKDGFKFSTTTYKEWVQFRPRLETIYNAIARIYDLPFFTVLALEYKDIVARTELGLPKDTDWSKLIQPYVLGELATQIVREDDLLSSSRQFLVRLSGNDGYLGVEHGLAEAEDKSETAYLIKFTFIVKRKVEIPDAISIYDTFNRRARNFFRWCITEDLHQAMEPKKA